MITTALLIKTQEELKLDTQKKQVEISLAGCQGLSVIIGKIKIGFYFRKSIKGKKTTLMLGNFPELSIEQAWQRGTEIRTQLINGVDPEVLKTIDMTVSEYIAKYYLSYTKNHKKSWKADVSKFNNHIVPSFGDKPLRSITTKDILQYLAALKPRLKNATLNKHVALLRHMYRYAIDLEIVTRSPLKGIKKYPENNQRQRYLNQEEVSRFMAACENDFNRDAAHLLMFLLLTGMRLSEALQAEMKHLDTTMQLLTLPETKNGKVRFVSLSESARNIIVRQQHSHGKKGFIFRGKDGISPLSRPTKAFYRILKHAGLSRNQGDILEHLCIHTLRHTFASLAIQNQQSLDVLKEVMGHSNRSMTERYAHLDIKMRQELVESVSWMAYPVDVNASIKTNSIFNAPKPQLRLVSSRVA